MPSVSKSQQRLMGVAYAVKSGSMELKDVDSEYRDKVASLVDGMTKKDLKKYASTKHDKLPETVDEDFAQAASRITPSANIGGMGPVVLPGQGKPGSGDVPSPALDVADIDDDEEEAKKDKTKKKLEMENFKLFTKFGDFINEAVDYNDPVLIRLRQDQLRRADMAKLDAMKKEAEKNRKKAMRRWNQKKYDQWLEDVAANDGWKNAYDMAQNAEFEPGLVDWVKKENPYEDPMLRIQYDIEAFAESVVTEKFVKEFDKAVLDAETEKDVLKVYPDAEFYVGKSSHFFGQLEKNLFFKAYYAKYYEEDYGKKIKGDFKITTVYSEKGSRYVNLYLEESAEPITEKKLDRDDMMKWIEKYMDFVSTTEEFNGSEGGIWVSGEGGDEYKGRVIYAYYSEDYKNRTFGVDNKWEKELNKRGWYSEWHDAGTSMIWPL